MSLTVVVVAAGRPPGPLAGWSTLRFVVAAARALKPAALFVAGEEAEELRGAAGEDAQVVPLPGEAGAVQALLRVQAEAGGQAETLLLLPGDMPLLRSETLRRLVERHRGEQAALTLLDRPDNEPVAGLLCFRDAWLWSHLDLLARRKGDARRLADLAVVARQEGEPVASLPPTDPLETLIIGDCEMLAQAEAEMRRRINSHWLQAGVILIHPQATYIEAEVEIGAGTVIWPNTLLQGRTQIGQGCILGPGSVIRDSTIGNGCRVELSVVEQAIMEAGSEIGPFGHLRKGAHLAAGVHMGNFGEVKNSYLGRGAKMGHFSYMGDATVGEGANIGAGTITCNYDGQRKHRTIIGRNAFVGSGTMLVAPVEVCDNATTGAGSVVTRDVPADSVAYGVPARLKQDPGSEEAEVEERDDR